MVAKDFQGLVFGDYILYVGAIKDFNPSTPDCQGQNANKLFAWPKPPPKKWDP